MELGSNSIALLFATGLILTSLPLCAQTTNPPATLQPRVIGSVERFDKIESKHVAPRYAEGKNWVTQKFPGEEHSERAWRKRVHLPLQFLLSNQPSPQY